MAVNQVNWHSHNLQVAEYEVNLSPPLNTWIDLEDKIRFMR